MFVLRLEAHYKYFWVSSNLIFTGNPIQNEIILGACKCKLLLANMQDY